MARSSTTGMPYLVLRPDAGQYTYMRTLPSSLARRVTGTISLAWCDASRTLGGQRMVKISLGTGDLPTARARWAQIHPQVDSLVRLATLQLQTLSAPEQTTAAARLAPEHIRAMSGQLFHDILDENDRTYTDREFASPLTDVILRIAAQGGAPDDEVTRDIARRTAETLQKQSAERHLKRRRLDLYDASIPVSETIQEVIDLTNHGLKIGDRLSPEQLAALTDGKPVGLILSEVGRLLHDNHLDLPADHPDRRALALSLLRSKIKAYDAIERRDDGEPIETPPRPPKIDVPVHAPDQAPVLSSLRDKWIKIHRPSQKQIDDNGLYVGYFIGIHGDLPVDKIKAKHIADFLMLLLQRPRNVGKSVARGSLREQVAWGENTPGPRLARGTINAKGLGSLSTLMTIAVLDGLVPSNPCVGQALPLRRSDVVEREPYDGAELKAIIGSSIYAPIPHVSKAGAGVAAFWLPLLALFTGGRLEELGQLLSADIKVAENISFIEVTDIAEDDDEGDVTEKKLKTSAARRCIPVHADLISCGFLEFVRERKSDGHLRLFPELTEYRGRYTRNWSKYWGRFADKYVTKDKRKTFHSLRHNFIRQLREAGNSEPLIKALVGHAQNDTTSKYGRIGEKMYSLKKLNDAVQTVNYPDLDLSHLQNNWGWQNEQKDLATYVIWLGDLDSRPKLG